MHRSLSLYTSLVFLSHSAVLDDPFSLHQSSCCRAETCTGSPLTSVLGVGPLDVTWCKLEILNFKCIQILQIYLELIL